MQLGRCAERLARMEFSANGFDVYVPDVDDHSVNFMVRSANRQLIKVWRSSAIGRRPRRRCFPNAAQLATDEFAPRASERGRPAHHLAGLDVTPAAATALTRLLTS